MKILPCHLGTYCHNVYFSKVGVMLASCGLLVWCIVIVKHMSIYLLFTEFPVISQSKCGSNFPFPHCFYSIVIFQRISALQVNDERTKKLREGESRQMVREEKTVKLRPIKYKD